MSETEHRIGVLFPMLLIKDIEKSSELILEIIGEERDEDRTAREQLDDVGYKKFHITDDAIYMVKDKKVDADGDIMRATKSDKGWIDFEVRYYNGGCSFTEAIDESLKRMKKSDISE